MCVSTPSNDRQIVIDDNIVVTVVLVRGESVRVCIEPFEEGKVSRGEMAAESPSLPDPPEARPT